jgi:hypothetical protein
MTPPPQPLLAHHNTNRHQIKTISVPARLDTELQP